MDAVVLNCVTQFNIVWPVGTFPFLPMSKCCQKITSSVYDCTVEDVEYVI